MYNFLNEYRLHERHFCSSRGRGRVTRENKDESPGRTRTNHPGGQKRVTREDNSGYHERRFWAPKEVIRGLVQDHPLMLVGQ